MSETAVADATTPLLTDTPTSVETPTSVTPDAPAVVEAAPADAPVAPVYEFVAPDGVTYDAALIEKAVPLFTEANVPPEMAQKLVGMYAEHVAAMDAAHEAAQVAQVAQWEAEVKADPELGGAKLQDTLNAAKRAIHRFGGEEAVKVFGPLGSNPLVVRLFAAIGRQTAEDTTIRAAAGGMPERSLEERMYPTMRKE